MATQPRMVIRSYHVWPLQEAHIPAVVELAYAARISQPISHILFRDQPDEKLQRPQCERAVRAALNDPSSTCTIVKSDQTGEVVAFCIAKRYLNAEEKAKILEPQSKSPNEKDELPLSPTEVENILRARANWRGTVGDYIAYGAHEYEPPDFTLRYRLNKLSSRANEEGNLKPGSEARVQSDTVSAKEPVPTVKGDSKSSGQDSELKAGNKPTAKKNYSHAPFHRTSAWSEVPGTDSTSRLINHTARYHMNLLDEMMQGTRFIEIEYLWVKPGHRLQGIGSHFVKHCIKQAMTYRVPLYVRAEPTAHDFFFKLKFHDTMRFALDLAKFAPPLSGYGVHESSWMRWCPVSNERLDALVSSEERRS